MNVMRGIFSPQMDIDPEYMYGMDDDMDTLSIIEAMGDEGPQIKIIDNEFFNDFNDDFNDDDLD